MDRLPNCREDFNEIEKNIYRRKCEEGAKELGAMLEAKDEELREARDKAKYRYVCRRRGTIKTIMGEVAFMRRYYRVRGDGESRYAFLLDEAMGFDKRPGLMSDTLSGAVVNECMDKSFRKAAATISSTTGQTISAAGAWNATQAYGELAERREERLAELNEAGALNGEIEAAVVFTEADGLWLPIQGGRGKAARAKKSKSELKIATHYGGWRETARGRHETVGKVACAGFEEAGEFARRQGAVLAARYDMDGVEARVFNGDGAKWVMGIGEEAGAVMQLDPFHISRAVARGLPKSQACETKRLLKAKDIGGMLAYVAACSQSAPDEGAAKKAAELYGYLSSHRDILIPWDERGLRLPSPPEGMAYRRLGTQEHSNFYIVGKRMKRRGASWSISGGGRMAKLLCARVSGGYELPERDVPAAPCSPPLPASKAPFCDGHGYGGGTRGGWPYEGAPLTNGRKAVRDVLAAKPASALAFR